MLSGLLELSIFSKCLDGIHFLVVLNGDLAAMDFICSLEFVFILVSIAVGILATTVLACAY